MLAALAAGCRDRTPRLQPLPAHAVILAFGDSLTAGNGAPRASSYPVILQQLTGWQTINAGAPGEISAEGVIRLPGLLQRYHPDLVVLCHGGNDLLRRIAHQEHRRTPGLHGRNDPQKRRPSSHAQRTATGTCCSDQPIFTRRSPTTIKSPLRTRF